MKVRELMESHVITLPRQATYEEAARLLRTHKINGVPVVDEANKLIGVLSDKDLFRVLYPFYTSYYENPELYLDLESREYKIDEIRHKPIEQFMSKQIVTIFPDAPVMRAGAIMLSKHIHRLPVVDGDHLIGIITRSRIFGAMLHEHFGV